MRIGWLLYSSYFTDTEVLKTILESQSDFEWGFKIIPVTNGDKQENWNNRLKALGVFVPASKAEIATTIISDQMEASLDSQVEIPDITDKYLFLKPEYMMTTKHSQMIFKSLAQRQKIHMKMLK